MINSFADKETEKLYLAGRGSKFPASVCKAGIRKLDYLNSATCLEDLKAPPGNGLEALKGKHRGKYSIRINDQYRIVFSFIESDAYDVEITDYR
jgi:proteic killer suppression protein